MNGTLSPAGAYVNGNSTKSSRHRYVFDTSAFRAPVFDSQSFINTCLSHQPATATATTNGDTDAYTNILTLEQLQQQLQQYSEQLHTTLIDLLHNDYNQFLSLLTNLNGADTQITAIHHTNDTVTHVIENVNKLVDDEIEQVQAQLYSSDKLHKQELALRALQVLFDHVTILERDVAALCEIGELEGSAEMYADQQYETAKSHIGGTDSTADIAFDVYINLLQYSQSDRLHDNVFALEKCAFSIVWLQSVARKLQHFTVVQQLTDKLLRLHELIIEHIFTHLQYCYTKHDKNSIAALYRCVNYMNATDRLLQYIQHDIVRNSIADLVNAKHLKATNNMHQILTDVLHIIQHNHMTLLQFDSAAMNQRVLIDVIYHEVINQLCANSYYICSNNKQFQPNYTAFRTFVHQIERLAHVDNLLQHDVTQKLYTQFNTSVYYQLVLTYVVETVEKYVSAVNTTKQLTINKHVNFYTEYIDQIDTANDSYILELTSLIQQTAQMVYSHKVYIYDLNSSFVKLLLQALARYTNAFTQLLTEHSNTVAYNVLAAAVADIDTLTKYAQTTLRDQVLQEMLHHPHASARISEQTKTAVDMLIRSATGQLTSLQLQLSNALVAKLVSHSQLAIKKIKKLKFILSQRHNASTATTVSAFIVELLVPIKQLFAPAAANNSAIDTAAIGVTDGESVDFAMTGALLQRCSLSIRQRVFEATVHRVMADYRTEVVELIDIVQKTQRSLQKLNLNKAESSNENMLIYAQLSTDIAHLFNEVDQLHSQFGASSETDDYSKFRQEYEQIQQIVK